MQEIDDRLILEELEFRRQQKAAACVIASKILEETFKQQNDFINDPSRNKAALCTRRAGKTEMWPRYAVKVALENPRSLIRIWAINRLRCKQLVWENIKGLCARHQIKLVYPGTSETELTLRLENGSEIRLLGADKDKEAQKKRGDKTILEIILETQLFGSYLQKLVEEVSEPCTMDLKGTICLEGTPGPILTGYWHAVTGNENVKHRWTSAGVESKNKQGEKKVTGAGWSVHHWSVLDNPHLPHMREELALLKIKRNWDDENPTYIREWLGRWVNDLGALFYAFDPVRNVYEGVVPYGIGWQHTLGWDLGSKDDMSLVVWAWHPKYPTLFEAFSWKQPGALAKVVMKEITDLEQKGYNFVKKVADTQGGGKMYVEDVMSRHEQVFEAAKKGDKYDHVRLFNDDLREGNIKLMKGSVYAEEISGLARDLDWPPEDKPDELPIEDYRCPNHCCDAGLYAYRAAWHFLHTEEKVKPKQGTEAWVLAEEKKLQEQAEEDANRPVDEWWEQPIQEWDET